MKKVAFVGAAVALVLAGCSSQAGSSQSASPSAVGSPTAAACDWTGAQLSDFYVLPNGTPNEPLGTVVRCQQATDITSVQGYGNAYRVMYVSEDPNDSGQPFKMGDPTTKRYVTGVVFVPSTPAPEGGRKVVAWAHGTQGMGVDCAPSRATDPELGYPAMQLQTPDSKPTPTPGFILNMMQKGWVVAATDYAGFGTTVAEGQPAQKPLQYLVGAPAAFDAINSVRAARVLPTSQAGTTYGVYGQSQGGQTALAAGQYAKAYAPELSIVGSYASDPAAEMQALVAGQWNRLIAWILGPEVMVAWPTATTGLNPQAVMTDTADKKYGQMAQQCVTSLTVPAGLEALQGIPFFSEAVLTNQPWQNMLAAQTPWFDPSVPMAVGQTQNDKVVLASTTALLQQKWCDAGANLRMHWVPGPNADSETLAAIGAGFQAHMNSAFSDAPSALEWLDNLFAGGDGKTPMTASCSVAPPQPLS